MSVLDFATRFIRRDPAPLNMLDFPTQMRVSLAAHELAKALLGATREAWSAPPDGWADSPQHLKRAYDELARQIILELRPTPRESYTTRLTRIADRLLKGREWRHGQ